MNAHEQKINELVAKHIFNKRRMAKDGHAIWASPGERLTFGIKGEPYGYPIEYIVKTVEEAGYVESEAPDEMDAYSVLRYCTDMDLVGPIIKEMGLRGFTVSASMSSSEWSVEIDSKHTEVLRLIGWGDTLPMALCVASLAMLGVHVPVEAPPETA